MTWAFKELAKAKYSIAQIFEQTVKMGLICSRNNFSHTIRNPIYCGLIKVAKHKDEDACLVKGLHEPIISVALFHEVQDVLSGKKRTLRTKIMSDDRLPLRGFITCSKCTRTLCASASKGRNDYYYYYHCSSHCGCRHKADEVNKELE